MPFSTDMIVMFEVVKEAYLLTMSDIWPKMTFHNHPITPSTDIEKGLCIMLSPLSLLIFKDALRIHASDYHPH